MTGREKRKKLLIAESEAYRQLLRLELQNLRIHGFNAKRELTSFDTGNPLLMTAIPMLTSLFRGRSGFSWKGLGTLAMAGWQLYRVFNPAKGKPASGTGSSHTSAAEEYLRKRV